MKTMLMVVGIILGLTLMSYAEGLFGWFGGMFLFVACLSGLVANWDTRRLDRGAQQATS